MESALQDVNAKPCYLSLELLKDITNDFSNEREIGRGGFGVVYKGILRNGEVVAVKRFAFMPGVKERQFENELYHLMMLEHQNIVRFLGYCYETRRVCIEHKGKFCLADMQERLICLEFLPNGSLDKYISDESCGLDWRKRYKIIVGICCGLQYLHEEGKTSTPIVHLDLKPANVLLTDEMVPKITDFGLSRLFSEQQSRIHTMSLEGSLGYMAPEYLHKGKITTKSDIFSLGVIFIEVITGHKDYPDGTVTSMQDFIEHVLQKWKNRLEDLSHTSLEKDMQQIRRCIEIGLNCVQTDESKRPTVKEIIKNLNSCDDRNLDVYEKRSPTEQPLKHVARTLFSQPVPPANSDGPKDEAPYSTRTVADYLDQGIQKLLILGSRGAGTSTIFKQAKLLYGTGFTKEELESIKLTIQSNIFKYMAILLEARECFEEEASALEDNPSSAGKNYQQDENKYNSSNSCMYSINSQLKKFSDWLLKIIAINPNLKKFSDWLLDVTAMGDLDVFFPAATREYATFVDELWKHPAIQATYKRNELDFLPDAAEYFLCRAIKVSSNDYEPSEKDIIHAEGLMLGNGLSFFDFTLDDRSPMSESFGDNHEAYPQPVNKYQLIRVSSKGLKEGCKWVEMFEDVHMVIFSIALSEYNEFCVPANGGNGCLVNKMIQSRDLFETTIRQPCFRDKPFVLVLNKYDLFEKKIRCIPLSTCEWFSDFCPLWMDLKNQSLALLAFHYVATKFKRLYVAQTSRKLFVCQACARDRPTIDKAFRYIQEILRWEDKRDSGCYGPEESFCSTTELSSSRQNDGVCG